MNRKKKCKWKTYYKAINWNAIEDVTINRPGKTGQSNLVDTRILVNDLDDWRKLSNKKKKTYIKSLGINPSRYHAPEAGASSFSDIRTPMKKLLLTTSNLWNLSMLSLTLLSFHFWILSQKSKRFWMDHWSSSSQHQTCFLNSVC